MTRQRWISQCGAAAIVMAFASAAAAQMNVTTSDIQRLQDDAYQAGADVSRLRSTDPNLAAQLQTELDDLRDEFDKYQVGQVVTIEIIRDNQPLQLELVLEQVE